MVICVCTTQIYLVLAAFCLAFFIASFSGHHQRMDWLDLTVFYIIYLLKMQTAFAYVYVLITLAIALAT